MLKSIFYFFSIVTLLTGCSPNFQVTKRLDGVSTYNITNTKKPLAIVLPENQSDVFNDEVLQQLSKKYRIICMPFMYENEPSRQIQLDGLTNRQNYFSELLQNILVNINAEPEIFIAEGFNSLIVLPMATSYKTAKVYMVNGMHQPLMDIIVTNCYSADTSSCSELIKYLQLLNKSQLNELLQFAYSAGYDVNLGNYSSNFWLEVINYSAAHQLPYYKGELKWIYFRESGLLREIDAQLKPTNKYILTNKKEFFEKPKAFIDN